MFGENLKTALGIKNNSKEEIPSKGSKGNPYSQAELIDLKKNQLRKEQLTYFDGYVNDTSNSKNPNIRYLNFVEKDSNVCTVNLSPSQKRTFTRLSTLNSENGSPLSHLSVLVKDGDLTKKMVIEIGHNLPTNIKKEIVDTVYRRIDSRDFLSDYKKWDEKARVIKAEECRQDLLDTVKGIIRKNIDISEDEEIKASIME